MQWQLIVLTSLDFPLKNKAKKANNTQVKQEIKAGKKGVKKEETVIESELLVQDWKKDDIKFTEVEAIDIIKPEPIKGGQEQIDEGQKCWKGYEKKGMKTMFGSFLANFFFVINPIIQLLTDMVIIVILKEQLKVILAWSRHKKTISYINSYTTLYRARQDSFFGYDVHPILYIQEVLIHFYSDLL